MTKQVEFYFDIVSPASYLAWTQMPKFAAQAGAEVLYRPFFLPGLFQTAGSASPITVPNKGRWLFQDLIAWAKRYGVPFRMNSKFPMSSLTAMRGLIAWQDKPEFMALGNGFYQAMWVDDRDISDGEVIADVVQAAGISPQDFSAAVQDPAIKQRVFDINEELAARGAFGAPTFFVGKKMFWGQDRLDFVAEALSEAG